MVDFQSYSRRAKNGGLDPAWLDFAVLGSRDFQFRGPKIPILKIFGTSELKFGAPQKREIDPHSSETGRIRFWRARFQTRELSELLSACYLCANANSSSVSQNSQRLPQNSVRLSEFTFPKQYSRNSIPPVS